MGNRGFQSRALILVSLLVCTACGASTGRDPMGDGDAGDRSVDGIACTENSDCVSGHCSNDRCCASGVCCALDADCPGHDAGATCNDAGTCQGTRSDIACVGYRCMDLGPVDDDSGCAGLVASECGPYPALLCTDESEQPVAQASLCSDTCASDADCDQGGHCAGDFTCVSDGAIGDPCLRSDECSSGLQCVDSVCCTSACEGLCRACDVAEHRGTCWNIGLGEDPDEECDGFSCAAFFWGWAGNTCWSRDAAPDAAVGCDGEARCQSPAQVCPASEQGSATTTCDALCQKPAVSTCEGTLAGACDNIAPEPASETCGVGQCERMTPRCTDGVSIRCQPGAPSAEVCDNLDQSCSGIADDTVAGAADPGEPNNVCGDPTVLGTVDEPDAAQTWTATIYPASDTSDWYRLYAQERGGSCIPGTDKEHRIALTLEPPSGADCVDYDLNLYDDNCAFLTSVPSNGCSVERITHSWTGACGVDSSRYFRVEVRAVGAAWECRPYALTIDLERL